LINALAFVVFLFLYRFVPNTQVSWRDVWMGALVAAICFEITKSAFVWFVGNFSYYNLVYGPVGTVIALLVWTYMSALILLFCAELTSVYTKRQYRHQPSRSAQKKSDRRSASIKTRT